MNHKEVVLNLAKNLEKEELLELIENLKELTVKEDCQFCYNAGEEYASTTHSQKNCSKKPVVGCEKYKTCKEYEWHKKGTSHCKICFYPGTNKMTHLITGNHDKPKIKRLVLHPQRFE